MSEGIKMMMMMMIITVIMICKSQEYSFQNFSVQSKS